MYEVRKMKRKIRVKIHPQHEVEYKFSARIKIHK